MSPRLARVRPALLALGAAVAVSAWLFRGSGIGLFIDGALILVFI